MKKYTIFLSTLLVLIPMATSATLLGWVGGYVKTSPDLPGFASGVNCKISDTDRGTDVVQAVTLADAEAINDLYLEKWHRRANCEELQRHLDWGTPLGTLSEWLESQINSVIGDCSYPAGTTKDAVANFNNIYREEAGRDILCSEALFHLKGTPHDVLRNWLINDAAFNRDYQEWKNSFQLTEGATYRDGSKFWLIQNGQRYWVPDVATLFASGLIFDDSTYINPSYKIGFYYMVPEGEQLKFWEGAYKTAVVNRFRGSGYGEMPERLEDAIWFYRHPGSTWRGWSEFSSTGFSSCDYRGNYDSLTRYCEL